MSATPASRSSVIDLGVLPPPGEPDLDPVPAGRPGAAAAGPGRPRRWRAAAAAGLVVLALGGAAPDLPWLRPHFTVPSGAGARSFLTGDSLYVLEPGLPEQRTLVSYRLSDGAIRWRVAAYEAHVQHDLPIVVDEVGRMTWVDPVTGEGVGSGSGYVTTVTDQLVIYAQPASVAGVEGTWDHTLTAWDRRTGDVVWRIPGVHSWSGSWRDPMNPAHLIALHRDAVTSYDLTTGAPLRSHPIPAIDLDDLTRFNRPLTVDMIGEVVLAGLPDGLAVFDLTTMSPLWRLQLPEVSHFPDDCGGIICVGTAATLRAFDPVTGEPAWSVPLSQDEHYGPWPPGPAGHFVSLAGGRTALHDSATGGLLWAGEEWLPYMAGGQPADPASLLLTRYQASSGAEVERTGPHRQRVVPVSGQTWFARLLVDPPRLEVLGAAPSGRDGCLVDAGHIACREWEQISVWRVR